MPPKPADLKRIITNDGIEPIIKAIKKLGTRVAFRGFTVKKEKLETIINLGSPDYWKIEDEDIINELNKGRTIDQINKRTDKRRDAEAQKKPVLELYEKRLKEIPKKVNYPDKQLGDKIEKGKKGVETLIIPPRLTLKDRTSIVKVRRPGGGMDTDGNKWDSLPVVIPEQTFIEESEVGTKFSFGWVDDAIDDIMEVIAKRFYEELAIDEYDDGILTVKEQEENNKYRNEQKMKREELQQKRNIQIDAIRRLKRQMKRRRRISDRQKIEGREYRERLIRQRKEERFETIYKEYLYLQLAVEIAHDNMRDLPDGGKAESIDDIYYYKQLMLEKDPNFDMSRDDEDVTYEDEYDRREDIENLDIFPEIRELFDKELLKYIKVSKKKDFDEQYKIFKLRKLKNDVVMDNDFPGDDKMIFYKRKALQYLDPDFNMDMSQQDEDFDDDIIKDEDNEYADYTDPFVELGDPFDLFNDRYVEDMKNTESYYIQLHEQELRRQERAKEARKEIKREKRRKEKAEEILKEAKRKKAEEAKRKKAEKARRKLLVYPDANKEQRYQDYKSQFEAWEEANDESDKYPDDEDTLERYENESRDLDNFFEPEDGDDWPEEFEDRRQEEERR